MGDTPRRSAFRLPWMDSGEQKPDEPALEEATAAADASAEAPASAEATSEEAAAPAAPTPVNPEPPMPAATEAGEEPAEPNQFLKELVDAMRGVAESSRDSSMEELRTSLDQRIEELRAAAAERADDLRRRSDHDITEIGEWERTEIERVRTDAEHRRDARRTKLEKELADHEAASEAEIESARRKLDDYEHELAAFFAELGQIQDPATFVAAAKRMPPPPLATTPSDAANGAQASSNGNIPTDAPADSANGQRSEKTLSERLAELDQQLAAAPEPTAEAGAEAEPEPQAAEHPAVIVDETPEQAEPAAAESAMTEAAPAEPAVAEPAVAEPTTVSVEAEPVAEATAESAAQAEPVAEVEPVATPEPAAEAEPIAAEAAPVTPEPAAAQATPAGPEALTPIVVKGLGSFGAITSFKQALERVDGVNGVTLSLGPTGEFVYRATHAPEFDIVAAIRQIEGPGAGIEQNEGQVLVTIERQR